MLQNNANERRTWRHVGATLKILVLNSRMLCRGELCDIGHGTPEYKPRGAFGFMECRCLYQPCMVSSCTTFTHISHGLPGMPWGFMLWSVLYGEGCGVMKLSDGDHLITGDEQGGKLGSSCALQIALGYRYSFLSCPWRDIALREVGKLYANSTLASRWLLC